MDQENENEWKLPVLDSGFVRLVDYMGSDLSVIRAARVSYDSDADEKGQGSDQKLINYLMKNHHTSPFEAVTLTFEVQAPIFIFRQWHRHRTWSYNEVSARYTELDMGYYVPRPENIGVQSKDNKQVRDLGDGEATNDQEYIAAFIDRQCEESFGVYKELLATGCPRELARSVLPVATYSRMFATVDLHNLFHFLRLRLHPHSQFEIRRYAQALLHLTERVVPISVGAFRNHTLNGVLGED